MATICLRVIEEQGHLDIAGLRSWLTNRQIKLRSPGVVCACTLTSATQLFRETLPVSKQPFTPYKNCSPPSFAWRSRADGTCERASPSSPDVGLSPAFAYVAQASCSKGDEPIHQKGVMRRVHNPPILTQHVCSMANERPNIARRETSLKLIKRDISSAIL